MRNINTMLQYGNEDTTVIYLVNTDKQTDLVAMPVLFTENRFIMGTIIKDLFNEYKVAR